MDDFRQSLLAHFDQFERTLATDAGDWVVKDFTFLLQEKWRNRATRKRMGRRA